MSLHSQSKHKPADRHYTVINNRDKKHVRFTLSNIRPGNSMQKPNSSANSLPAIPNISKTLGPIAPSKATLFYEPGQFKRPNNTQVNVHEKPRKSKVARNTSAASGSQALGTVISSTQLSEICKLAGGIYPEFAFKSNTNNKNPFNPSVPVSIPTSSMLDYNKDRPMTLLERKRLQWEKEREELNSLGTPWGCPIPSSKSISTQNLNSWPNSESKIGPTPLIVSSRFMSSITNTGSEYHLPKIGLSENKANEYDFWCSGEIKGSKRFGRKLTGGISAEEEIFTSGYQSEVGNNGFISSGQSSRNGSGDHAVKQDIMCGTHQSNRRHTVGEVSPQFRRPEQINTPAHVPAAMRSSFTNSLESADQDAYKDLKKKEQQEWLRDLDRQRQEQAQRKRESENQVGNGRWGDRGVVVGHSWEPAPNLNAHHSLTGNMESSDYSNGNISPKWAQPQQHQEFSLNAKDCIVNSVSSPSLLVMNFPVTPNRDAEVEQRTFIRGQNVPVDPEVYAQRERKRLLALQHQEEIRKQIEERQERLRAEKAQQQREEAAYEARVQAQALAERKRMEMEKYINNVDMEPHSTIAHVFSNPSKNSHSPEQIEIPYFASTRKNIESSPNSLIPDVPAFTQVAPTLCDSCTQTEDGKEYVYISPTPVENILAEEEEGAMQPKVKVASNKPRKVQEDQEEIQEKTISKSKERERPRWGVPPKTKVYLKQSEKDPFYQQRLKSRKERMKRREEEIFRSKHIIQEIKPGRTPKSIPAYDSDSEVESFMQQSRRNLSKGGLNDKKPKYHASIPSLDHDFNLKQTESFQIPSRQSRKKDSEPKKIVRRNIKNDVKPRSMSRSPMRSFRETASPPVPALKRRMDEGVDPEEFGFSTIDYDYKTLDASPETVLPPKYSPPVSACEPVFESTVMSSNPADECSNEKSIGSNPIPRSDKESSSESSIDLDLSIGEIALPRNGLPKSNESSRSKKSVHHQLPKSMVLRDDNTQLDPRAESPLRRLLESLQSFSIRGGTNGAGDSAKSSEPDRDVYSSNSNRPETRGTTTDLSARENLIAFILDQGEETTPRSQNGISQRENTGILEIKLPQEYKSNVERMSKPKVKNQIIKNNGKEVERPNKSPEVQAKKTQEYQDPLSIEKRRTLDWLYGRKGSASSQSSLLSHLSSLKRGIKHQEEEWGLAPSDTEMSQASSYYPHSSN